MAAILYMADFDAKDAFLALDAAYEHNRPFCTRALIQAGYSSEEVGQSLKTAFYFREDEIAANFFHADCSVSHALTAVDGAYALSSSATARALAQGGYGDSEIRQAIAAVRDRDATPWYRRVVAALGKSSPLPWQRGPGLFTHDLSPVKIYLYDIPNDLLYLRQPSLTRSYFQTLKDRKNGLPLQFDLNTRMLARHYYSEAGVKDWTQQYGYEFVLHEELKRAHHLITRDPEEADFFLIPHFTTSIFAKLLKNVEFLGFNSDPFVDIHFPEILNIAYGYLNAVLDHIRSRYPYFDRSSGRDHLLICTWDNGIGIDEKKSDRGYNVTHMLEEDTIRELKNVIQVTYHGDRTTRYFSTNPYIIIPPYINDHLVKRIRADPRSRDFSRQQRSLLSFFLGSAKHHPMRETYQTLYRHDSDMLTNTEEMKTDSEKFEQIRLRSRFSICMEGYTPWTMRLSQAFLFGCVPVIVSENIILPFERSIDWSECSIQLSPREIPRLKEILAQMPEREGERLQRGVAKYADHILFDSGRLLFEQDLGKALLAELINLKEKCEPKKRRRAAVSAPWRRVLRRAG